MGKVKINTAGVEVTGGKMFDYVLGEVFNEERQLIPGDDEKDPEDESYWEARSILGTWEGSLIGKMYNTYKNYKE